MPAHLATAATLSDTMPKALPGTSRDADTHVRIINAITGELLRELTIDPSRDYQPRK